MGQNRKVVAAHLGQDHLRRDNRPQFFNERQQQHFALRLFEYASGILQRFAGDNQQRRRLPTGGGLLQHRHQKGFIWQLGYRETGRLQREFIVQAQQSLLVTVIAAHQHADFIVMM